MTIDHDTPLLTIPRPALALDVRRVIVANALACVNLDAGDPRLRPVLAALLGPVEGTWDLGRPFRAWRTAAGAWRTEGVSTCGLVAEGLWRRAGVAAPWLREEYVHGKAIARAIHYAMHLRPRGAWRTPGDDARPERGDYVVIGSGLATHALTCVAWRDDVLVSVDGGQVGRGGLQAVHRCERPWRAAGGEATLGARGVIGWIDAALLPGEEFCEAPQGWESVTL